MADTLATNVRLMLYGTHVHDLDLVDITATIAINFPSATGQAFATGTGNEQADLIFHDSRSCKSSTAETLDLSSGTLEAGAVELIDEFGQVLDFVKVKVLAIHNKDVTRSLTIGGAAARAWETWCTAAGDSVVIPPLGVLLLTAPNAGFAVVDTASDLLLITPSADTETAYDIVIIGTSA